jgi:PAS domain S-box-containing protein
MPLRQIAPVALVLGLTIAGFFVARLLGERDARRESEHAAEVAAAQIRGRVEQGASLADSLRRFMVGVPRSGVTREDFASNSARWLSPAGFPAAAWVEAVPAPRRATYERRIGHPIVARDPQGRIAPVGSRPAYLPATLVSGIVPMAVPGIDLGGEVGVNAALARASTLYDAGATPLATRRDGTKGLFLIRFAPRLTRGVVHPGFVVLFAPELWLRAAATNTATLRLTTGGTSTGGHHVRTTFTEAGQLFGVAVPLRSIHGAAAVLPWIILGAGLVLAAFAAALGVNDARRARAQDELDRIFSLSPDLITVADFDGHVTRVNPAVEQVLGYTEEEFMARPYLDLVHPDDRERSAEEAAAISQGKTTLFFENRFIAKDGSARVLEWTSTPVVGDGLMYGVARDVTERRQAETELRRLADEHAALRRVATLVAKGVSPAEVFAAVAEEVEQLLDAQATTIGRLELDGTMGVVASSGTASDELPVGTRLGLESSMAFTRVVRTGRSARIDDYSQASDVVGERARRLGIRCTVAVPIMVEGSLWGSIAAMTAHEHFAADAEQRMAEFTELAGTALANAQSRSELTASRARVVAASDQTRRQIERDLHDGAQQRLVHTVITLKMARQALQKHDDAAPALVAEALDHAERATVELRELVQGILPPVLTLSGLHAAVRALADRTPVPVEIGVEVGRFPAAVEATAYFVVAEALTNVAKHSGASHATVVARVENGTLRVEVRDDGVGGARADGSGFVGLADRLAVLDGHLRVDSPAGGGTLVAASIRLSASPPDSRERWPTLSQTVTRR